MFTEIKFIVSGGMAMITVLWIELFYISKSHIFSLHVYVCFLEFSEPILTSFWPNELNKNLWKLSVYICMKSIIFL